MAVEFKNFIVSINSTIKDALEKIDFNKQGVIFVADVTNKVVGIATDGDIRRGFLKNISTQELISTVMNKQFVFAELNTPRQKILKMLDHKIHVIPMLNSMGHLCEVITRENFPLSRERKVYARAKSPVRISFGGGGSDLTHYFFDNKGVVVNTTISLYSRATLKKNDTSRIRIYSADLKKTIDVENFESLSKKESEMSLIVSVLKLIKPDFGFDLNIESEFPIGSGLGGSAVVLSAIIGCFNQFREDRWDNYEIAELAFQAERLTMNVAGGWQDQYATVFGGFNFMEFDKDHNVVHPLRINQDILLELEASLILCHTGIDHKSGDIHQDQKQQMQSEQVLELVNKNKELTYQMKNQLLKGQLVQLSKSLDEAWALKKQFSSKISNDELDTIYQYAKENGALGGKILGAGGGGYFLFFVNPFRRAELREALVARGLTAQTFTFDHEGLQSWTVKADE